MRLIPDFRRLTVKPEAIHTKISTTGRETENAASGGKVTGAYEPRKSAS